MYPKVKVRQVEEDDPTDFLRINLKDHHNPSNSKSNSPEHEDGYTPPHVRVPMSHTSSVSDSKISARAGKHHEKVAEIDSKPSSVLPPRAVLSSPENDAMLGTKRKTKTDRSGSNNHKLRENTHSKCKKSYKVEKERNSSAWK